MNQINFAKLGLLSLTAIVGCSMFAADAVTFPADKWTDGKAADQGATEVTMKNTWSHVYAKDAMPVAAGKKYKISGKFMSDKDAKGKMHFYFGVVCMDKNKRGIESQNVFSPLNIPMTELTADAPKGAKTVMVKDASKWKINNKFFTLAFNAKKDFSDLPNYELANVVSVKPSNGQYEVTLQRPLNKDYAAKTALRLHNYGATYTYTAAAYKQLPATWTEFSGVLSGFSREKYNANQWRHGTAFTKPVIMVNSTPGSKYYFKDIKIEEVK